MRANPPLVVVLLASGMVATGCATPQPLRQATGGLVYFPIDDKAKFVWVQPVVGGHTFSFRFAQTITQVRPPPPAIEARQ